MSRFEALDRSELENVEGGTFGFVFVVGFLVGYYVVGPAICDC